jgi:RNA polymerase sigma-70 factor (ECF subfamily)
MNAAERTMTNIETGCAADMRAGESAEGRDESAYAVAAGVESAAAAQRLAGCIAAVARGDSESLGVFYDATLGSCFALALRIVRDHQAAEDICEDVYLQVWRSAGRFDPERGNAMAWLMTICRSRALDYVRRRRFEEPREDVETLLCGDAGPDPLDLLGALDAAAQVTEALRGLSAVQRQVIALAFYRDLSHQEIAQATGLPLGTVKSHARRALGALRAALDPDLGA